jgi:hypothetical protein
MVVANYEPKHLGRYLVRNFLLRYKAPVIVSGIHTLRPDHETETFKPNHAAALFASLPSPSLLFSAKAFCPLTLPS